jgi:hypothetical protein
VTVAEPPESRRSLLLKAKCRGLVRTRWPDVVDDAEEPGFPAGAALLAATTAWVLAEDDPARSLGGALVWAKRHDATSVHLLAADHTGLLARRAAHFEVDVEVWRIDGAELHAAVASQLPPPPSLDPSALAFVTVFEQAGADVVEEAGILRAEVLGLEVARVEVDDATGQARLAVGVGKHDREARREIRGDAQGFDDLFEAVRIVAEHRVPAGTGQAAFHLSPERWLRSVVVRRPDLVGAYELGPVPSPNRRDDLRQTAVAPAAGTDGGGAPLLVVCSVGTDLDLVPSGVDAWLADGRRPHLRFVVPEGDDYRATRDLVAALRLSADLVTVPPDWRAPERS